MIMTAEPLFPFLVGSNLIQRCCLVVVVDGGGVLLLFFGLSSLVLVVTVWIWISAVALNTPTTSIVLGPFP